MSLSEFGSKRVHWSPPVGSVEPMLSRWRSADLHELLAGVGVEPGSHRQVVAIDGRSGSGKSTLAARLQGLVPGAAVVATDDVAWNFSMFDWAAELAENVLRPFRQGERVDYRPPGWRERGREGAVRVPAGTSVLFVEGVGASRAELAPLLDAAMWVQSDFTQARERCLARDVETGVNGDAAAAAAFWDTWQSEEIPFLEQDRPWERARLLVAGVPMAAEGTWLSPGPGPRHNSH